MKILSGGFVYIDNQEFNCGNINLNIDTDKPITFQYAELIASKGRIDYYEDGLYKSQSDLSEAEFKAILSQYDDILKQAKLLELNEFNEPKYVEIDGELVEQTEPTQDFIKNKLLAELEAYYEDCKNISINVGDKTITHRFDSKWRNLLDSKIDTLIIATKLNKPENVFTWLADGIAITLNVEQLEELKYIIEQEIIQPNYNNLLTEMAYINSNNVTLDYDYKKNFLHNQVIKL